MIQMFHVESFEKGYRRGMACFALVAALFSAVSQAQAICTNKCDLGWAACDAWCGAHNKTSKSENACHRRCERYWNSGANPQSIGPADPATQPGSSSPGRVKTQPLISQ